MIHLNNIQRFKIARIKQNVTVEEVAQNIGVSSQYVYECLKYPNKNPEINQKVLDFINEAEALENVTA